MRCAAADPSSDTGDLALPEIQFRGNFIETITSTTGIVPYAICLAIEHSSRRARKGSLWKTDIMRSLLGLQI